MRQNLAAISIGAHVFSLFTYSQHFLVGIVSGSGSMETYDIY
jgi:hypothetical protein